MNRTSQLVWMVVVLTVIAIGFVWGFHNLHSFSQPTAKDTLIIESAKTLLQVVGVAALGGLLKYLYDEVTEQRREAEKLREEQRANQTAANEIRKGLLNDLIAARSGVEKARRKYLVEESTNPLEQYRTTILEVLDARLTLSHIFNAIETSNYLFSAHRGITNKISKMKVYLDELIDEYESEIGTLRALPEAEQIPRLRELKVFGDFIRKTDLSNYVTRFLDKAYRPAVSEIRKEVIRARQVDVNEINQNASLDETG